MPASRTERSPSYRPATVVLVALPLALVGCGGGETTTSAAPVVAHQLGGTVSGLSGSGLVLANGSDTLAVPAGATQFTMPEHVNRGTGFDLSVQTQPVGQACTLARGSGMMADADVTDVAVTCATSSFALDGDVSGLTTVGLVLANGSDTLAVSAGSTSFTMPQQVTYGSAYTVTVQTQPVGATCTVGNSSGTITDAGPSGVSVTCEPNRFTVGGTVADLIDPGLVLANGGDTAAVPGYATSFTMPQSVAFGSAYAVTVQTQPVGASCSVTDGSGSMGSDVVTNVAVSCVALPPVASTYAGSGTFGHADGNAADAAFRRPGGVAFDGAGNLYVADYHNHVIRKITPAGVVGTLAGIVGGGGYIDGTGSAAAFFAPIAVAVDSTGNVYVADQGNHAIRKITPAGDVTTLAGTGSVGSADGIGTAASFSSPFGIAVGVTGLVYVADSNNNKIRKITPAGEVGTFAGSGAYGSSDGLGVAATFAMPAGIAVDAAGNLVVADHLGNTIRKVSVAGEVTTLAGSGATGNADGTGTAASFDMPFGVTFDAAGNVYVADHGNHRIRKVSTAGQVSTFAGSARGGAEGVGAAAQFDYPVGLAIDAAGHLFVGDYGNMKIRKLTQGVN